MIAILHMDSRPTVLGIEWKGVLAFVFHTLYSN